MPPVATRAKFSVESRTETKYGHNVTLRPVVGGSGENETFFKFTPAGEIRLEGIPAAVAQEFTPGASFYVDFTKAE